MYANRVAILMTGAAFDCVDTVAIRSTANVHGVAMAVVSLTGVISGGVAIHTARVT
jgi:hypothetical protein